ncbi:MAG: DUF4253 domain-containing protein [Lachnospiraceae bacterium]
MQTRLFLLYFPGSLDGDEIIGIYDDITDLKAAYKGVLEDREHEYEILLQSPHTELTIKGFDKDLGEFETLDPESLWEELVGLDKYKKVKYGIDDAWQYRFWRDYVSEQNGRLVCDGNYSWTSDSTKEEMDIYFKVDDTVEIMEMMGVNWGGWNKCSTSDIMAEKMREWGGIYGAQLMEISHDTLVFRCQKKLEEKDAETLLRDISDFPSNALDIADYETIKKRLIEEGIFVLWWD